MRNDSGGAITSELSGGYVVGVASQSKVDAADYYVGTYSDGTPVYLLTETIQKHSKPTGCTCTIRAGRDYLNYNFYPYNGSPYYRNSEGYSGYVNGGNSPVASNIYRYVVNNF